MVENATDEPVGITFEDSVVVLVVVEDGTTGVTAVAGAVEAAADADAADNGCGIEVALSGSSSVLSPSSSPLVLGLARLL